MGPQGAVCVSILVFALLSFHLPRQAVLVRSARHEAPRALPAIVRVVRPVSFGGLSLGGCA